MSKTAEEILAEAARIVEKGWCQNALSDDDGNVCALGALMKAVECEQWTSNMSHLDAWMAATKEMGGVVEFNNSPGRIAEEVAMALRNAKRWL